MKLSSPSFSRSHSLRSFGALLLALAAAAGCGDDEAPPAPQPDFGISVVSLDGASPEAPVTLRCDGTLAVGVEITTTIAKADFDLRPAAACGESKRCGYVRVQALGAGDEVLSQVDTATKQGVLELASDARAELERVRVALIRGFDQELVTNKDGSEVVSEVTVSTQLQSDCDVPSGMGGAGGGGGQGGAGGALLGGAGGAGGSGGQGGALLGGAGGTDASGAGGQGGLPSEGGAAGSSAAGQGEQP